MSSLEERINILAAEAQRATDGNVDTTRDKANAAHAALERLTQGIIESVNAADQQTAPKPQRILKLLD